MDEAEARSGALPLSKTLDPVDFEQLGPELAIVDEHFHDEREQHPMRRWEYAMALRAIKAWTLQTRRAPVIAYDVGGAGSPFRHMTGVQVVDPDDGGMDLQTFVHQNPRLADVVTCLSVIEHVEDLDEFCYHLSCLVAPGGLLFLTMDYCDGESTEPYGWPTDSYMYHWMRKRIFNLTQWRLLLAAFNRFQFHTLGDCDWAWHGAHVEGYTFASLALIKRP